MQNAIDRQLERVINQFGKIGVDAADDAEIRLKKVLLFSITARFIPTAVLWGIVFILLGKPQTAAVPLVYSVVSLVSVIGYRRTRNFELFRVSQLLLLLVVPFLIMLSMGGFINGSGVIILSLLSPLGALLFGTRASAFKWFVSYGSMVILSGLLQPFLVVSNPLPAPILIFFFVVYTLIISGMTISTLYFFILQRDKALDLLNVEREKTETLLLNVLPKEIAAILRNDDRTIADYFDAATILFADVANFTPMSAGMNPADVVNLLNEIFSYFDALAEKYHLEKIKTIGDCYMVAAGVPNPRPDHAQAVAHMALDMCNYVMQNPALGNGRIDFRIGIHSGPVVAGVIGRKKFIYDLWGDSVNTASRMESHGTPGKIQISADTYTLLRDDFICEARGHVAVKGKGDMETWYLVGEKNSAPAV